MGLTTSVPHSVGSHNTLSAPRKQRVFFTAAGKCGGRERVIAGRRCLFKKVDPARHQLTRPPAWASDESVLEAAEREGLTHALFEERDSGRLWCARIAAFRTQGLHPFNRGYGRQVALALHRWASGFDKAAVLNAADRLYAPHTPALNVAQVELFTGTAV